MQIDILREAYVTVNILFIATKEKDMGLNSSLRLNEKIKQIRRAKGLSQAAVAEAIDRSEMHISRIERGEIECKGELLETIKRVLGIENAPLSEQEVEVYEGRLWILNDLLNANRVHEAREMVNTMPGILDLPFEKNLIFIYRMHESRLTYKELNPAKGLEILEDAEALLKEMDDNANIEALHLYYRNKAYYTGSSHRFKEAIEYYLKALSYESNKLQFDPAIYVALALSYYNIGKPYFALLYCMKAMENKNFDITNPTYLRIQSTYARCLFNIGLISEAIKMLEDMVAKTKTYNDAMSKNIISQAFITLIDCYIGKGDYDKALTLCEEALTNTKKENNTGSYLQCLAMKILCAMKFKQHKQCIKLIKEGLTIAQEDSQESYIMWFKSLNCLVNLKDASSVDFLENEAIPFFRDAGLFPYVLTICRYLEEYYKKNRSKIKALNIVAIIRDIYQEIHYSEQKAQV